MRNTNSKNKCLCLTMWLFALFFTCIFACFFATWLKSCDSVAKIYFSAITLSLFTFSLFAILCNLFHKKYFNITEKLSSKQENELRLKSALEDLEEKYRAMFDESSEAILLVEKESGAVADLNSNMISMLGYTAEELVRLDIRDIEKNEKNNIKKIFNQKDNNLFTNKKTLHFKTKLHSKSGILVDVFAALRMISVNGNFYFLFVFKDISKENQMEMILQNQRLFSNSLLEANPIPIFYKNKNGKYFGCNTAFEKFMGIQRNELIGKTIFDILPKDLAEKHEQKDKELLDKPGIQTYNCILRTKNGGYRNVILNNSTYSDKKGNLVGIIGSINDVTELHQKNNEIKLAYERWQNTFDSFSDMVFIVNRDYKIILSNKAVKQNFLGEYVNENFCHNVMHGTDAPPNYCLCHYVFDDKKERNAEMFISSLNAYVDVSYYPVMDKKGEVIEVIHVVKNINAKKKAENDILKSRKILLAQNKTMMKWIDSEVLLNMPLDKMMKEILRDTSLALKIAIAGIWFFDSKREKITCACNYDSREDSFTNGAQLLIKDYPAYFESILQDKVISADNAHVDPGTMEMLNSYLRPNGINSMLDALICIGREPLGIICCEHTGEPRNWTIEESNYIISVANLISLYFQATKIENTEKILDEQLAKLKNLTTKSDIGLIVMDKDKKVLYVNPSAERFFGERIKQILGEKCPSDIFDEHEPKKIQIITADGKKGLGLVTCEQCDWESKKAKLLTIIDISTVK